RRAIAEDRVAMGLHRAKPRAQQVAPMILEKRRATRARLDQRPRPADDVGRDALEVARLLGAQQPGALLEDMTHEQRVAAAARKAHDEIVPELRARVRER